MRPNLAVVPDAPRANTRADSSSERAARRAFINITSQVRECLVESGIKEGFALVNAMHITASVFINDDERGLHHDYETWLEKLAPQAPDAALDMLPAFLK